MIRRDRPRHGPAHVARYRWSDDDAVVEVAFACGSCRRRPMLVVVLEGAEGPIQARPPRVVV
jgi:hypothetical protein